MHNLLTLSSKIKKDLIVDYVTQIYPVKSAYLRRVTKNKVNSLDEAIEYYNIRVPFNVAHKAKMKAQRLLAYVEFFHGRTPFYIEHVSLDAMSSFRNKFDRFKDGPYRAAVDNATTDPSLYFREPTDTVSGPTPYWTVDVPSNAAMVWARDHQGEWMSRNEDTRPLHRSDYLPFDASDDIISAKIRFIKNCLQASQEMEWSYDEGMLSFYNRYHTTGRAILPGSLRMQYNGEVEDFLVPFTWSEKARLGHRVRYNMADYLRTGSYVDPGDEDDLTSETNDRRIDLNRMYYDTSVRFYDPRILTVQDFNRYLKDVYVNCSYEQFMTRMGLLDKVVGGMIYAVCAHVATEGDKCNFLELEHFLYDVGLTGVGYVSSDPDLTTEQWVREFSNSLSLASVGEGLLSSGEMPLRDRIIYCNNTPHIRHLVEDTGLIRSDLLPDAKRRTVALLSSRLKDVINNGDKDIHKDVVYNSYISANRLLASFGRSLSSAASINDFDFMSKFAVHEPSLPPDVFTAVAALPVEQYEDLLRFYAYRFLKPRMILSGPLADVYDVVVGTNPSLGIPVTRDGLLDTSTYYVIVNSIRKDNIGSYYKYEPVAIF